MSEIGTVYLVGAGPGDAGLLTVRGAELLARADVVVHDTLVNPELLALAPATARRVHGGKRAGAHNIPQDELNALLVSEAKAGRTVVRLKGGDPYVFGRGGEEALALAAAKVPFEVVPGVSSVIAVPAYAGIPLTHRDFCSAFQVVTGHEDPDKPGSAVDWAQLARFPGTKVVLMGMDHLRAITARLLANGLDGTTPAAVVRWGTYGRQETLVATVATLADEAAKSGLQAPAVIVIGGVVTLRGKLDWCSKRPLFGKRIVVTRTRDQAGRLSARLREHGADVLEIPTIRIAPPDPIQPLLDAVLGIGEYDWLVFTSPNGVDAFFDTFFKAYPDIRSIGNVRIAAVGPATAERVKERRLAVDVMPEKYLASQIAKAIDAHETVENLRVALLRAEVANPELPAELEELRAIVDDVPVYKTVPETDDHNGAAARFADEGADWITFTSSSTVENFHARFPLPALLAKHPGLKTASIGPETSKALSALGIVPTVEARQHTIEGLVKAIEQGK